MTLRHRIDVAAGRTPADLLLTNARVVSVFADSIHRTSVAIADGVVVGFGDYRARRTIDLKGAYLSAGFTDSHIHIESSLLTPAAFARAVVPHGTTAVVADPHEIANVEGAAGVRWMIRASAGLPLTVNIVLPSCVPESNLVTSGARLTAHDLKKLTKLPRVIGIGEVMNYPAVIAGTRAILEKIRLIPGMRVDGHAPGLTGKALAAYIVAGIHSDHESTTAREAREKLADGLHLMIRQGTTEKNLSELASIVTPANAHRCCFCSDDRSAHDLIANGHIDDILRSAVAEGIAPITALQMATNNAPYYFRLKRRTGAVAIGYVADLVVLENLKNFRAQMVFKGGTLVAREGKLVVPCTPKQQPRVHNSMHVKGLAAERLVLRTRKRRARVIRITPHQIITREEIVDVTPVNGIVAADPSRDLLKLAVIERHRASGRMGVGLVRGFGLKRGALASSVCHDSHNLIVVGASDVDMIAAARALIASGGGFAIAAGGKKRARLELPVAGLMSNASAEVVSEKLADLNRIAVSLGSAVDEPFLALSFLALSVIPELRLTDRGLVDARIMKRTAVFL